MLHSTEPIEVKFSSRDAAGEITGYASTFGNEDLGGDIVLPGAFAETLRKHRENKTRIAMLWAHDMSAPIGTWDTLEEDAVGLRVSGRLNLKTNAGREALGHVAGGSALGLSIGYAPTLVDYDSKGRRLLKAVQLYEISLVALPMNPRAEIDGLKHVTDLRSFERWLRAHGLPRAAATMVAVKGWPALKEGKAMQHHSALFSAWLRDPRNAGLQSKLAELEAQLKDIGLGAGPGGGFAVPRTIEEAVERQVAAANPFRILCGPRTATSENQPLIVTRNDQTSGTAGETDNRTATGTSTFVERQPKFGEYFALPSITEWALDDIAFDVEAWLAEAAGDVIGAAEANDVVRGNGSSRIEGFLNTPPELTPDGASPRRAAGALQYFDLASSSLAADDLTGLIASVRVNYLTGPNVGWVAHPEAVEDIRSLKLPGEALRETDDGPRLYGYRLFACEQMDAPGRSPAGWPLAFGNWRRGYALTDRTGLRVSTDDVSVPGKQRFYIRRRTGGTVLNHECLKLLRF